MSILSDSPILSQETRPTINAYLIDAGEHNCCVDDLGEIGCIYEDVHLSAFVFAHSPGAARKLFIDFYGWGGGSYVRASLEWTDKMSIRVLAKDIKFFEPHVDEDCDMIESGFPIHRLTKFGQQYYERQNAEYDKMLAWEMAYDSDGSQS